MSRDRIIPSIKNTSLIIHNQSVSCHGVQIGEEMGLALQLPTALGEGAGGEPPSSEGGWPRLLGGLNLLSLPGWFSHLSP